MEDITEKQKKIEVTFSYFKWFLWALVLAALGVFASDFVNNSYPLSKTSIKFLQLFSLSLEAAALGQCGYEIQTWGGESPSEKLNRTLFVVLSSIAFFLISFSFYLEETDQTNVSVENIYLFLIK